MLRQPLPQEDRDEKALVLAFKSGEDAVYQVIYERYIHKVKSISRRMLGDPHDAEEAAQEAFVRVYQSLGAFNGRYQLGAWITRITTNVCLDQLRSRSRRPSDPTPLEELILDPSEAHGDDEPESSLIRRAESRHVRRVLAGLPPMHRAAIVLRDFEGLSYQEVAIALGITEAQTKALIHRARKNFKRSWSPLEVAQLLLPWRLLQRIKRVDVGSGENAAHVARASADAVTSASYLATSCSSALQQCGQFMGERITALATTVIVGSAAIGGVAVGRATAPPAPAGRVRIAAVEPVGRHLATSSIKVAPSSRQTKILVEDDSSITPEPATTSEASVPPSEPTPTTTPEPAPSDNSEAGPTPEKTSGGEDSQSPSRASTQVTFSFDRSGTVPGAAPTSNAAIIDCAAISLTQEVEAPLWDLDRALPAAMSLRVEGGAAELTLSAQNDSMHHSWNGGATTIQSSKSGDTLVLSFSGSYSWSGGMRPAEGGLPDYGRFTVRMSLDCVGGRVLTESLLLTT